MACEDALWPIHPKPITDEALSSWLFRIAEGHGMPLSLFRALELPHLPGAGIDLDLIGSPAFFEAIAAKSGTPKDRVFAASYLSDEGLIFTQTVFGNYEWIAPLTLTKPWSSKRFVSLPFCGLCLGEDSTPYYRKNWRYAFWSCCPKHGLLSNECPSCHQPFSYADVRSSQRHVTRSLTHCGNCNKAFAHAEEQIPQRIIESAVELQGFIQQGIRERWVDIGSGAQIHIAMFLRGLRVLIAYIARHKSITDWIATNLHVQSLPVHNATTEGSFESRPAAIRAWWLVLASSLLQEWPSLFIRMVKDLGLPASSILPPTKGLPAWMVLPDVEQLFYRPQSRSPEETEAARRFLARTRGYPATPEETASFMETGVFPSIKPTSRPATPAARKAMDAEFLQRQREKSEKTPANKLAHTKTRKLYSDRTNRRENDELFALLDNKTLRESALTEKLREIRNEDK